MRKRERERVRPTPPTLASQGTCERDRLGRKIGITRGAMEGRDAQVSLKPRVGGGLWLEDVSIPVDEVI